MHTGKRADRQQRRAHPHRGPNQASVPEGLISAVANLVNTGPVLLGAYTIGELTAVDAIVDFLEARPRLTKPSGFSPPGCPGDHGRTLICRLTPTACSPRQSVPRLVTVTHCTTQGSAEIAGASTDLILARHNGRVHVFSRGPAQPGQTSVQPTGW